MNWRSGKRRERRAKRARRAGGRETFRPRFAALESRLLLSDVPLPAPQPLFPLGAAIYQTSAASDVQPGETDSFLIDLKAGQTIAVWVDDPLRDADPMIEVLDPLGAVIGTSTSVQVGEAFLQPVNTTTAGEYRINVSHTRAGRYDLTTTVLLNAAFELESLGVSGNDSPANAQSLDGHFESLAGGAARAAVVGDGAIGFGPDVYSFTLDAGDAVSLYVGHEAPTHTLTLLDSTGAELARGERTDIFRHRLIQDFVAPAAGTYYAHIDESGDYTLAVLRDGHFDAEPSAADDDEGIDIALTGTAAGYLEPLSITDPPQTDVFLPTTMTGMSDADWRIERDGSIGFGRAFDGQGGLRLNGFGGSSTNVLEDPGFREVVIGPTTIGSVTLSRKVYVPQNERWARFLEIVRNDTAETQTFSVEIASDLASGFNTELIIPSAGTEFDETDDWLITDDDADGYPFGPRAVLHVIDAPGGIEPAFAWLSRDELTYRYDLTLAPGETQIVMHLAAQGQFREDVYDTALQIAGQDPMIFEQMAELERRQLANYSPLAEDVYAFEASAGDALSISTQTPAAALTGGADVLMPHLELVDPRGVVVAANTGGAADGRHALINFDAALSGQYVVRVSHRDVAGGEYVLRVDGATAAPPPFMVASSTPGDDPIVVGAVTQVVMEFNDPVRLTSIDAADLLVDGAPAVGVTVVDGRTIAFELASPLADGDHTLSIAAGALTNFQGADIEAYSASFTLDAIAPRIISSSIHHGDVHAPGTLVLTMQFSEPMRTDVPLAPIVDLEGDEVDEIDTGIVEFNDDSLRVVFFNVPEDFYTLVLQSSAFRDPAGNRLDGERRSLTTVPTGDGVAGGNFVIEFEVDATAPLDLAAFSPVAPPGGRAMEATFDGRLDAGEEDARRVELKAGQTLAATFEGAPGVLGRLELRDPSGALLEGSPTGERTHIAAHTATQDGHYTIHVHGESGSTRGVYAVRVLLNADVEAEAYGGADNSTPAQAAPLIGAVVGRADPVAQETQHVNAGERNLAFSFDGLPATGGDGGLLITTRSQIDRGGRGIRVQLEGVVDTRLFDEAGSFERSMFLPIGQSEFETLLADGTLSVQLTRDTDVFDPSPVDHFVSVEVVYPVAGGDYYELSMDEGESVDVSFTRRGAGSVMLELLDTDGVTVLARRPLSDADPDAFLTQAHALMAGFVAPAAGTHYLRVTGAGEYALSRRAASFADEAAAEPTDLTATQAAFGHVSNGSPGRLFVFESGANLIAELNPQTGAVLNTFAPPALPEDFTIHWGLATTPSSLLFGFEGADAIYELDPNTGQLLREIPLPFDRVRVSGLAYLNGEIFAESWETAREEIFVFDAATGELSRSIQLWVDLDVPAGIAAAGDLLWAAGRPTSSSNEVDPFAIDPISGDWISIDLPFDFSGDVGVIDDELFLSMKSRVRVYDLSTFELKREFNPPVFGDILAIGADGPARDGDAFTLSVNAGDALALETLTPGDTSSIAPNTLDPMLTLLDPTGAVVASDDDGAADGRNARIAHTATMTGVYRVRIEAGYPTQGEYVLLASGATGDAPAFEVASVSPAADERVSAPPTRIEVTFNDGVLLSSLDAGDLTVNGAAALGVTAIDARTVAFDITPGSDGVQMIELAAGAVRDLQGTPLEAFNSSFVIDTTPPHVVEVSVQEGETQPADAFTVSVQFDERLATAALDAADVSLVGALSGPHAAQSVTVDDATLTLTAAFGDLPDDDYALTLHSGDGGFEDLGGWDLDGEATAFPLPPNQSGDGQPGGDFEVSFVLDTVAPRSLPPFDAVAPLGSLVYTQSRQGVLTGVDTDAWSLALDAGQILSVLVERLDGADHTIGVTVRDPQGDVVASASPGAASASTLLQTAAIDEGGEYTIEVIGDGGSGAYGLRIELNRAVETESAGGAANDTAAAQDVNGAFIDLGVGGAARMAIAGDVTAAGGPDHYRFTLGAGQRVSLQTFGDVDGVTVDLLDESGALLAASVPVDGDALRQAIIDFVAPAGDYIARINPADAAYQLVLSRDARFADDGGPFNSNLIDLTLSGAAFGYIDENSSHRFTVDANAGDTLVLTTSTSGGGDGAFVNVLDPRLILSGPAPVVSAIADDDNELPDGRNAQITHTVTEAGRYTIEIEAAHGPGEYALHVAGHTAAAAGSFTATIVTPADGLLTRFDVSAVEVRFSHLVDFSTLSAGDLTINGAAAAGFTPVDGRTVLFDLTSPVGEGAYDLALAGGAVSDIHGRSVAPVGASFTIDQTAPRVTSADVQAGVAGEPLRIVIGFDENVREALATSPGNVLLRRLASNETVTPTTLSYDDATRTLTVEVIDATQGEYEFVLRGGAAGVADAAGNLLDGEVTALPIPPNASGEGAAGGDFVLPFSHFVGAFAVESTDIAEGQPVNAADAYTVHFNRPIDAATVDAGDLTVNGVAATDAAVVDHDTITFTLPALTEGTQDVAIAAGAIQDSTGGTLETFSGSFVVDQTGPRIVAVSVQEGETVMTPLSVVTIQFDEPIDEASLLQPGVVRASKLDGVGAFGDKVSYDPATRTATIELNPVGSIDGPAQIRILGGSIYLVDLAGNPLDGEAPTGPLPPDESGDGEPGGDFLLNFHIDTDTLPLPDEFEPFDDSYGLAFHAGFTTFLTPGDTDRYTFDLLADQMLHVTVRPDTAEQLVMVELFDPMGALVAQSVSPAAGSAALLAAAPINDAGEYTLAVSDVSGHSGEVVPILRLNYVEEIERTAGGARNDQIASAQDLTDAFTTVAGGVEFVTVSGVADGQTRFDQTQRDDGAFALDSWFYFYGATPAIGPGTLTLRAQGDFADVDQYLSLDIGDVIHRQLFVTDGLSHTEMTLQIDLTAADIETIRDGDLILIRTDIPVTVRRHSTNFLEMHLAYESTPAPPDVYRVDLSAGERLDAALRTFYPPDAPPAGLAIALTDDTGAVLARSAAHGAGHIDLLRDFAAPADGAYYLHIGGERADYKLTVARHAALHDEADEGRVDLSPTGKAIGSIDFGHSVADEYVFHATAGDELVLETALPVAGPPEQNNALAPYIELIDPTGATVASDVRGHGDGRNARITHTAQATGEYTVRVSFDPAAPQPGLIGEYYQLQESISALIPPPDGLEPTLTRIDPVIDFYPPVEGEFAGTGLVNRFLVNWRGFLYVETPGVYELRLGSDDGSRLWLDGQLVIDNDFGHSHREVKASIELEAGMHPLLIEMFDIVREASAQFKWIPPDDGLEIVPAEALYHGDPSMPVPEAGAYVLRVSGHSGASTFRVRATDPPIGGPTNQNIQQIAVHFNHGVAPGSLDAADLRVNGAPAVGVTLMDGDTALFDLAAPLDEVEHQLAIDAGAIVDSTGRAVTAFDAALTIDTTGPRVIATSIAPGQTLSPGPLTINLQFSEPVTTRAVYPPRDMTLATDLGPNTLGDWSFAFENGTDTVTFTASSIYDGSYTITLDSPTLFHEFTVPGFTDAAGNHIDGPDDSTEFELQFNIDTTIAPLPALEPLGPGGDLAHGTLVHANIAEPGDIDEFTIALDAGQQISLSVESYSLAAGRVELIGPGGATLADAAFTESESAWLLNVPADDAGEYRIRMSGADGAEGRYSLHFFLNLTLHDPRQPANTRAATAQSIDPAFIALAGGSRAAIQRTVSGNTSSDAFYRFTLSAGDIIAAHVDPQPVTQSSTARLRIQDATGTTLVESFATGVADHVAITDFVAPADGQYLLIVGNTQNFAAQVARNIALELGVGLDADSAQAIDAALPVIGSIEPRDEGDAGDDYFKLTLDAGQTLSLTTSTPGDAPLEFVNALDPVIELFDPTGASIALDDNSAADGRNAQLAAPIDVTGEYVIRVGSNGGADDAARGVYLLAASVEPGGDQPPAVGEEPVIGGGDAQRSMVTSVALQFSEDVSASLSAGDLMLMNVTTGTPVDVADMAVEYHGATHTAEWTFPGLPGGSLPDGNYDALLPADAVHDATGKPLAGDVIIAFFRYFGDADGDRDVDFVDLFVFRAAFQTQVNDPAFNPIFDVDVDGDVDFIGLFAFRSNYQQTLSEPGMGMMGQQLNGASSTDQNTDTGVLNAVTESPVRLAVSEPSPFDAARRRLLAAGAVLDARLTESPLSAVNPLRRFHASLASDTRIIAGPHSVHAALRQ